MQKVQDESKWITPIKAPLLLVEFNQKHIDPMCRIDDKMIRQYYDKNPQEFGHPEQIRLRNIYRKVSRQASVKERELVKAEIQRIHEQLKHGGNFGELLARNRILKQLR